METHDRRVCRLAAKSTRCRTCRTCRKKVSKIENDDYRKTQPYSNIFAVNKLHIVDDVVDKDTRIRFDWLQAKKSQKMKPRVSNVKWWLNAFVRYRRQIDFLSHHFLHLIRNLKKVARMLERKISHFATTIPHTQRHIPRCRLSSSSRYPRIWHLDELHRTNHQHETITFERPHNWHTIIDQILAAAWHDIIPVGPQRNFGVRRRNRVRRFVENQRHVDNQRPIVALKKKRDVMMCTYIVSTRC